MYFLKNKNKNKKMDKKKKKNNNNNKIMKQLKLNKIAYLKQLNNIKHNSKRNLLFLK